MTKAEQREKQIEAAMRSLGLTREEAIEMLEDDEDVERGEIKEWDLSPEEHKKAMKNSNTGTKKVSEKKEKKPRKENPTKRLIINQLTAFLSETDEICAESVEITNPERVIRMVIGEDVYEITLSQKRKPKEEKSKMEQPSLERMVWQSKNKFG